MLLAQDWDWNEELRPWLRQRRILFLSFGDSIYTCDGGITKLNRAFGESWLQDGKGMGLAGVGYGVVHLLAGKQNLIITIRDTWKGVPLGYW